MTFTELLGNVGLFGGAVIICLAVLSLFSVGMIVDKHCRFRSASQQSEMFKPVFKKFMHGGEISELIDAVRQHQNSHVAQVVSAGIHEYDGVRHPLTAAARCDGEAANFAISASRGIPGVGKAEQRRLLRAFAQDQVERRGCSGLRMTG